MHLIHWILVYSILFNYLNKCNSLRITFKRSVFLKLVVSQAVTDDTFHGHQGNDLLNWAIARPSVYRVKKESSIRDLEEMIAENMVISIFNQALTLFSKILITLNYILNI